MKDCISGHTFSLKINLTWDLPFFIGFTFASTPSNSPVLQAFPGLAGNVLRNTVLPIKLKIEFSSCRVCYIKASMHKALLPLWCH